MTEQRLLVDEETCLLSAVKTSAENISLFISRFESILAGKESKIRELLGHAAQKMMPDEGSPALVREITSMQPNQNGMQSHRLEFSPLEAEIMSIVGDDWIPSSGIVEILKYPHCKELRVILGNLVDRKYLESSNRGYRRAP